MQYDFPKMKEGGVKGRLKLFRKFIRCCESSFLVGATSYSDGISWLNMASIIIHDIKGTAVTLDESFNFKTTKHEATFITCTSLTRNLISSSVQKIDEFKLKKKSSNMADGSKNIYLKMCKKKVYFVKEASPFSVQKN